MYKKNIQNNYVKKFITKSNSLIEARYKLNLQESRVILWLLGQINFDDEDFKPYYLDIKKFAEITSLNVDNQYAQLKKITRNLTKKSLEIYDADKKTLLHVSWLSAAFYEFTKGYVILEFSPYLKPYLLNIKNHFTTIKTSDLLKLKSIYSIRIFELLKQYENVGKRVISIEELRLYCGVKLDQYRNYNAVKLYIIERAKDEINNKTEYKIGYKEIKKSRKIVSIEWSIHRKDLDKQKHLERVNNIQKELRSKQIITENLLEYGFGKTTAKKMITIYGEETVRSAIKAVNIQIEKGKVKNSKAMLQTAIKEKWHPEVFKVKKLKE